MNKIMITSGNVSQQAELYECPTAQLIWDNLPIEGYANTWGEEIYFEIPVEMEQEPDARAEVKVGELGYWPTGRAFCVFFGPTPASTGNEPRAYSPVNIVGRVLGDPKTFLSVCDSDKVKIERSI